MKKYKGISGVAGVDTYSIRRDHIYIKFKTGPTYIYDYDKPGKAAVEDMKRLAKLGKGLTTYINQYVRDNYAVKL